MNQASGLSNKNFDTKPTDTQLTDFINFINYNNTIDMQGSTRNMCTEIGVLYLIQC